MVHRSSDLLQRFALGELEGDLRDAVVAELAQCAECRAIVGAFARGTSASLPDTRVSLAGTDDGGRADAPGDHVGGRYRIEDKIGEGGMGVVFRVEHVLLGRRFALKMLRGDRASHDGAVRRFMLEARAMAALGHEGIVDVVDVGHDARGRPFIVMPLLEGETLEARMAREPVLPVSEASDIALRIADALAAAHGRGVVHRDVKPANVFLVRDGSTTRVKLLDFGLAKLERDVVEASDPTLTRTGAILGTPRYMAPEQWAGAREVDARVDVFAWGVTTHRMLTGAFPYDVVPGPVARAPDVRALRPEVPLDLAVIVERAIATARDQRWDDAAALVGAWRDALARHAPAPRAPSIRPPRAARTEPSGRVVGRGVVVQGLAEALQAGARVLAVVGSEGVGKSAVLAELRRELARRGRVVAVARNATTRSLPFAALRHLVDDAGGETIELALRSFLARPEVTLFVESPAALDRESRRLVLALTHEGGAAIVLEARDDDTLGGSPDAEHLLARAQKVPLPGLDASGVAELVRARGVALDPHALARLLARTGGHPLFVLTCLALHEERPGEGDVPADLADAIVARLAAAPWREARAWQLAAVLGGEVTIDDLRALGAVDADDSVAWLVARGVLAPTPDATRYAFTAGLLAEVAERALPPNEVSHLHRSAALLRTRQLDGVQLPEAWARIALHHERAGDLDEAADAYALAALGPRASLGKLTLPDASTWSEAGLDRRARWATVALDLAARVGRARSDHGELALARVDGLAGEGRFEEASAAIDAIDASTLSAETRARALVEKGTHLQRAGRHDDALGVLADAEGAARSAGPAASTTLALAIGRHAVSLALAGRVDDARDRLWQAEEVVLTRAPGRRADLAGWKAQIAGLSGDLAERRDAYWAAVELFRAEGNARFAAFSLLNLGDTYARLGAYEEAERALDRASRECMALGASTMAGYAALNLGYVLARLGRDEAAAQAIAHARDVADHADDRRLARYATLYDARLGRNGDALTRLRALTDDASATGHDPTWAALRDATLAEHALAEGRASDALALARSARARADEAGALEEGEADIDLVLVRALDATGDAPEAQAVARRAAMRIREVARRIAGAHWRTFFLEDVLAHRTLLARASA